VTKFVFGRGSAPDAAAGGYSVPTACLAGLIGDPTSKAKGRGGKERRGKGKGEEGTEEERGWPP